MSEPLTDRLRLHSHELVNGGANASQLRADLMVAADRLDDAERRLRSAVCVYCGEFSEYETPEARHAGMVEHTLTCAKRPEARLFELIATAAHEIRDMSTLVGGWTGTRRDLVLHIDKLAEELGVNGDASLTGKARD